MSNPSHKVPASPQTGDTDTESLYGAAPGGSGRGPDPDEEQAPESRTPDDEEATDSTPA